MTRHRRGFENAAVASATVASSRVIRCVEFAISLDGSSTKDQGSSAPLWKVIGNGFARPFLDRGTLSRGPHGGINRLRAIAGVLPLLKFRPDPVLVELWSLAASTFSFANFTFARISKSACSRRDVANVKVWRRCGVDPSLFSTRCSCRRFVVRRDDE